jgi:peptidoglycan-associated lipoprotein
MFNRGLIPVALLGLALHCAAQVRSYPAEASLRFSEQISNGPTGACGCFQMQGAAADFFWIFNSSQPGLHTGLAFDASLENTNNINGVGYGLTLSTFTAGPRIKFPAKKMRIFGQALFGVAHGSGTQFPQSSSNTLLHSANSFALDLGGGVDLPLSRRLSLRFLQADYVRTSLPNNVNNWQNNLRLSAGLTLRF